MDISLLLKIAGIGVIVAVSHQLLEKFEKAKEYAVYISIAGIIIVLLILINEIAALYEAVQTIFGI